MGSEVSRPLCGSDQGAGAGPQFPQWESKSSFPEPRVSISEAMGIWNGAQTPEPHLGVGGFTRSARQGLSIQVTRSMAALWSLVCV